AYVLADDIDKVRTKNEAVFGNVNWRPVGKLTLTGGFRYLADQLYWRHHKVTGPNGDHIGPADASRPGANFGTPALNTTGNFSDNALIGKLTAKYAFTPDILVYTSYAEGFKGVAVDADLFIAALETQKPAAP